MDLRQLKYFVGVVAAGSFTKAAEELNVAQSALSLHVRQMEEDFGTQLLVRDRTGVALTAAGEKLMKHARIILEQVRLAEDDMISRKQSPNGEVTIGMPSGTSRVMLTELVALAKDELPKVSLKIVEGMSGSIEEWLAAGRFNMAVLYRTADNERSATVLVREELCLVAPSNLPPTGTSVRVADLHAFPLAVPMRVNSIRRSIADVIAQHGCNLDIKFEMDSLSAIVNLVMDGKAYSILTKSAIQREIALGSVRAVDIIDPVITRSVVLAVNPRDERSAEVVAVRALVSKVARQLVKDGKWPAELP